METIQVTLTEYIQGETVLVDEHPIVNDKDYCEIVETKAELHYSYDGCNFLETGKSKDTPKEELVKNIIPKVILSYWQEENWDKQFSDVGIEAPRVYDWEEDAHYKVNDIDNYVNNCSHDENYGNVINALQQIAEREYAVEIIDEVH